MSQFKALFPPLIFPYKAYNILIAVAISGDRNLIKEGLDMIL
jgi:hypothetical protein